MNIEDIEKPEAMTAFFDLRAVGYDEHMREKVFSDTTFSQFYHAVVAPIEKTDAPITIAPDSLRSGVINAISFGVRVSFTI